MTHPTLIVAAKTVTLLLGALITYFSLKAYYRTRSPALRALGVGFAVITVGAIVAGSLDLVLDWPLQRTVLVESVVTLLGFAIITYSLYAD